jgi:hypothetical protein
MVGTAMTSKQHSERMLALDTASTFTDLDREVEEILGRLQHVDAESVNADTLDIEYLIYAMRHVRDILTETSEKLVNARGRISKGETDKAKLEIVVSELCRILSRNESYEND